MKTYVIIGASAAGIAAVIKIHELDPEGEIICIAAQKEIPYNTCLLRDLFTGTKTCEQIAFAPEYLFKQKKIHWLLHKRVMKIDVQNAALLLNDAQRISFNKLLIATGTSSYIPQIPGIHAGGVFSYHTISDVIKIKKYMAEVVVKKAIVIGAGLTGLEIADTLSSFGIKVTVVDQGATLLPQLIDEHSALFLQEKLQKKGITFHLGAKVEEIISSQSCVRAIRLSSDSVVSTDLVIVAAGSVPNSNLAVESGIARDNEAILANFFMETSQNHVYTAGDVACVPALVGNQLVRSSLWSDAVQQGLVAGSAMAGKPYPYPGLLPVWSTHLAGLRIIGGGLAPVALHPQEVIMNNRSDYFHHFTLENNQLTSFLLIGNPQKIGFLRQMIVSGDQIDRASLCF